MDGIDHSQMFVSAGLEGAGAWMNNQAAHCSDELARLKAQLAPLQEAWTLSKAADYYQGLQQEWNIAAEGLFGPAGVLGQIAHAMNVNWGNYSDAEWSNIRTWQH
ncbi:hypothetical protein NE236_04315 [Actinoallomurus purpureus]|uniref:WXG100 family type VII secretion target n=1 Tax=Actinoallomurus purpureus TaxID=478114 RepID=UPI0020932A9C|nr:WXG100 family type VII secretion target [Actinoallomurus purpureus]MCO6004195.1 hypothetical protein [Actinoallomurus purpureus]